MSTVYWNRSISQEAHQKMGEFISSGHDIMWVAFPPPGGNHWSIVTDKTFYNRNVPDECHQKMKDFSAAGQKILCVAFPPQGGNSWSIVTDKTFYNRNVPDECHMIMGEMNDCHGPIRVVAFDPDGNGWSAVSNAKSVVVYQLPFDHDLAWQLWNGNWDDPKAGHSQGNPNGLQAFAFDFVHDANNDGVGESGQNVRAARDGTVYVLVESETKNSYGSTDLCKDGVGNYLVIDHGDGTFGTYWHLSHKGVKVNVGDNVKRGDVIAISGNTGTSSTPHLHFDVRTGWNTAYSKCNIAGNELPSLRIKFEANDHVCWIPRVGDKLDSNNM